MNSKINISIKKPCSENFNNFQNTTKGGYCTSCKKEVTDFTAMTDQEIQNYFKVQNNNTCGYFLESQLKTYLNTDYTTRKQKNTHLGIPLLGLSLLSLFSFNTSFAQKKTSEIEISKTQTEDTETKINDSIDDKKYRILSGIVLDKQKLPLPGAIITIKNTTINTSADIDGKFTIRVPINVENIFLVSYIGYDTNEFKTTKSEIIISLKEYSRVLMGEVSINQIYKSKTSFLDKLKNLFI